MAEDASGDAELITQVMSGERDAYRLLLQRYQAMVYALLLRQVSSQQIAEELTQETFVRAYMKLGTFRFAAKFSTWLIRIALNQASSYFSSSRCRQEKLHESYDLKQHELVADETQESCTQEDYRLESLRKALPRLKPKLREVIVLCSLDGRSYDETAEILQIPVGTVRSRLNSARLKLRDAIKRDLLGGEI